MRVDHCHNVVFPFSRPLPCCCLVYFQVVLTGGHYCAFSRPVSPLTQEEPDYNKTNTHAINIVSKTLAPNDKLLFTLNREQEVYFGKSKPDIKHPKTLYLIKKVDFL